MQVAPIGVVTQHLYDCHMPYRMQGEVATVTIRDVAKRAEVGIGTVSRVLNNSPNVSSATRLKVLAAIEELDFEPNPVARRLSLGRTHLVGVIVPFFTTPSVIERLRGIESALADSDYDFIIYNVENVPRRHHHFQNVPRRERIDGLVIITIRPTDEEIARIMQNNVQTVLIDQMHPRLNYVAINDVYGGRLATEHLIALGHHKIAFVSDVMDEPFGFTAAGRRYEGFRAALAAAGISFNPAYLRQGPHEKRYGRELALALLTSDNPPTAIVATSDTHAIGVLQAAQELGIDVPGSLSVIGYDDIEITHYLDLTTIRQPLFQTGTEGIGILLDRIENPQAPLVQLELPVELIVRKTTAPPCR